MKTSAIVLEQVIREYPGGVRALDDVSLRVEAGEWVAIMGSSGSGKTTLLNLVDGLDRPTSGRILVLGHDTTQLRPDEVVTFRRENIGLVFQQFHLIPYLTAVENVMLAQHYHSIVDREQALQALEAMQMTDRAEHLPSQLSGGEQQRVCIARALINDPRILLADEPTANLDEANERKVVDIFSALHEQGKTIIVATHDPSLGRFAERRLIFRRGRLVGEHKNDARAEADEVSAASNLPQAETPVAWPFRASEARSSL